MSLSNQKFMDESVPHPIFIQKISPVFRYFHSALNVHQCECLCTKFSIKYFNNNSKGDKALWTPHWLKYVSTLPENPSNLLKNQLHMANNIQMPSDVNSDLTMRWPFFANTLICAHLIIRFDRCYIACRPAHSP